MGLQNFLPLRREVMEHWVYKDNDYFKAWVEMLFKARFCKEPKKDIYEGSLYTLNYGEFLFSRPKWSTRLNIPDHKLKKLINLLVEEEMIEKTGRVGKSGATIYSLKNYDKYNNFDSEMTALPIADTAIEGDEGQPKANDKTAKGQPKDSQTPLKKNVKNLKNVKTDFVPPTFEEVQAYIKEMDYLVDAKYFYTYYANLGWKKSDGSQVVNWKNTTMTWNKKELANKNNKSIKGLAPATSNLTNEIPEWE
jgi:hypothetical protein